MEKNNKYYLNGELLYYAFISGGSEVLKNQGEINRINVFPVKDKDTGTNLASTVRAVMDHSELHESYKMTLSSVAEAALIGARGNSGVIFAQFLHGLNISTPEKSHISSHEFIESVKNSIPHIYKAIANPVEGTMLTVIREWSDFLDIKKDVIHDFEDLIIISLEALQKSLKETTEKLKVLRESGFVDAGAKGFVSFIEGVVAFIKNRNMTDFYVKSREVLSPFEVNDVHEEEISHRFCTEAVIKNLSIEQSDLKKILSSHGDSVVVAGSESVCRFHVHTDEPAKLFHELKDLGTISYQKVDDMVRQQERVTNRKWNIALVTDSTCDLSQDFIDFYQINMVPLDVNFGEDHYLDKVTLHPDQFYKLLETEPEFPKTSQANEQVFTNLYSHLASNYDAIIAIHLSSKLSGTYSNSLMAGRRVSEEFKKPIYVIDSKSVSGALGLIVLKAAKHIEEGYSLERIIVRIEEDIRNAEIFVSVRDLKFMIKGGRVSKPKGIIAGALGINPVISTDENGDSLLFGKTFSQKGSLKKIFKHLQGLLIEKKLWNYSIVHANNAPGAAELEEKLFRMTEMRPITVVNISPVIGMHAGSGSLAVSVLWEEKNGSSVL